jgi:hypothetical protein
MRSSRGLPNRGDEFNAASGAVVARVERERLF